MIPGGNTLPAANAVVANLAADFPGSTFSLVSGADFTVSAAGVVTRINSNMATGQTYTLQIMATGGIGNVTEIFVIRTGTTPGADNFTLTVNDDVVYGLSGNDVLNGGDKDDTMFGQDGNDTLNGGNGNDVLNGMVGSDIMTGGAGDDQYFVDDNTGGAGSIDVVTEAAGAGTGIDTVNTDCSVHAGQQRRKSDVARNEQLQRHRQYAGQRHHRQRRR